ncbi:PDDEXK nuclease domain-containing protein [Tannockella kyphosi]
MFDGRHFYIDLLFYNYLLKCFVIIDLKKWNNWCDTLHELLELQRL